MSYTLQVAPRCFVRTNINSKGEIEILEMIKASTAGFVPSYLSDSYSKLSDFIGTEEELKEIVKAKIEQQKEYKK